MRKECSFRIILCRFFSRCVESQGIFPVLRLGQRRIGTALLHGTALSGMDNRQFGILQLIRQMRMLLFHNITPALV